MWVLVGDRPRRQSKTVPSVFEKESSKFFFIIIIFKF